LFFRRTISLGVALLSYVTKASKVQALQMLQQGNAGHGRQDGKAVC